MEHLKNVIKNRGAAFALAACADHFGESLFEVLRVFYGVSYLYSLVLS